MREIKFRGINKGGNWCFGDLIQSNNEHNVWIHCPKKNHTYKVDPDTVGQFTGLYDADGREIYEGDIIKVVVVAKTPKWDFQRNFVVEWSVDGWYMEGDPLHVWILLHILKVIGNVHDNSELLEEMK